MTSTKRRFLAVVMLTLFVLTMPGMALAAPKPTGVQFAEKTLVIDLNEGKTAQIEAEVVPAGASQRMIWRSGNTKVATVSSSGLVTAKRVGKVLIGARPAGLNRWTRCTVRIIDSGRPTSIALSTKALSLQVGGSEQVKAVLLPASADQTVRWTSNRPSVASVTSDGVIVARKAGTALVRAVSTRNSSLRATLKVTVGAQAKPTQLILTPSASTLEVGATRQMIATPVPSDANASVVWKSSNTSVATVSSKGLVTAKKPGTVRIRAISKVKSSVYKDIKITIVDPMAVTGVEINPVSSVLELDESVTLTATVRPEGAAAEVEWSSSNTSVAKVTSSGKVTGMRVGKAVITASAGGFKDTITISVVDSSGGVLSGLTTEIPERYTNTSQISVNLAKIKAIQDSAIAQINAHYRAGTIDSDTANARKTAVLNAFAMYSFPWMTKTEQPYWRAANSLNGQKDFQPGRVYYGLPYIQCGKSGNYENRRYNVTKALSAGYYTKSSGYYLLNQSKKLDGMYVGNDCSSFVSMSTWGTSHAASYLNTTAMMSSSYYKTISGKTAMLPGDALVRGGSHTVMFLYYTNKEKTKMMIIEQGGGGGSGDIHNTVTCSEQYVSSYSGYTLRRATKF